MTNYTPGYDRPIPKNLVEMAHDETGQWLKRDELETWVFRRFQRLEQQIKRLEEEHEAKVIQNAHLMRERDELARRIEELQGQFEQLSRQTARLINVLDAELDDAFLEKMKPMSEVLPQDLQKAIKARSKKC